MLRTSWLVIGRCGVQRSHKALDLSQLLPRTITSAASPPKRCYWHVKNNVDYVGSCSRFTDTEAAMFTTTQNNEEDIQEEFVSVRGVQTPVLKLGHLKDVVPEEAQRVLMLIIPGNPGIPHYYEDFMHELYSHCNGQVPVWALGHAGHLRPPGAKLTMSDVCSTSNELYGLDAQVAHKVAFIKENIPSDVSLILIGHSIGCYMILNTLDHLESSRVLRCFNLFPTIEGMAVSPNGLRMTPVLRHLRWLVVIAAWFLCLIPISVRRALVKWWYRDVDYPTCMQGAILETLTPWTANFTSYLAKQEMNMVTDLQKDLIQRHIGKLSFYYGACDHWAPVEYYTNIIYEFPKLDARLCNLNLKHAFVLETVEGQEMAKIVWLWAQSHHHTVLSNKGNDGEETWVFDQ